MSDNERHGFAPEGGPYSREEFATSGTKWVGQDLERTYYLHDHQYHDNWNLSDDCKPSCIVIDTNGARTLAQLAAAHPPERA